MVSLDRAALGLTVEELAAIADVSIRTIYRYIAAFEEAGLPLIRDDAGRWKHFVPRAGRW